ncbi:sigma-54-dependent Fis family transcriptional regulator [candidate division KSB1 bacterium]|nr:sigma-54-dependent Fis family transcriptional regulator [candidate division KSB1 bacterium]
MAEKARRRILVVEDDELFREAVSDTLRESYDIRVSESGAEALGALAKYNPELVLLDINLPDINGIDVLSQIKIHHPAVPVIMITAYDSIPQVVESIKKGAFNYLTKPINAKHLLLSIEQAIESADMRGELEHRRKLQLDSGKALRIVGTSRQTEQIRKEISKVAKTDSTVLIEGETGTGKELVAQLIHAGSERAQEPCVVLNCGAIPANLVESELFGHKKGAFTGAHKDSEGKFRLAHRGTLLLDEIGELSSAAQVKLLRVLEEHSFYPVGESQLVKVDVRVIASTNRNLDELVKQGKFREDLLFRINVYPIHIPPLRERPKDIFPLTEFFAEQYSSKANKKKVKFSEGAKELLMQHAWKGNVRELRNVIERVVLFTESSTIMKGDLNFMEFSSPPKSEAGVITLPETGMPLEEVEKSLLLQALELAKHNKTKAAKLLNLTPPAFYYRLEKYGLK